METPKKKYGIQGILLLITIGLAFEEARQKTMADGKPEWHEASYFMSPLMQAFTGFNKLKDLPNEISDLDDAETVQVYTKIENDYNVPKSQVDEKVKAGLRTGLEAYRFFQIMTNKHPDFQEDTVSDKRA